VPSFPPLLLYSHPATGELLRRRWFLEVVDGADQGTVTEIDHSPALIGAAPASALLITDDTVSRYHAEVEPFAEGVRLRDLDSTNGTFLGEDRVRDAFLENNDEFRVGRTAVRVRAEDELAASEIDTDPRGVPPGAIERVGHAIAVSGVSRELLRLVRKIAPSSSAVLFEGNTGVGKATLARLLHDLSPRKALPFVSFAPRAMIDEQEARQKLFGRGAKGAMSSRPSLFETAKGGTLFIEDIGYLQDNLQEGLLRAIESGEIQRDGDDRKIRIDVRFVASTSRDLWKESRFSRALARRVAVVRLRVPSLAERREDVRALAEHFYQQIHREGPALGAHSFRVLEQSPLPGNLDQLRVLVASCGADDALGPTDENHWGIPHTQLLSDLKRAFVNDVLEQRKGHVGRAAQDLHMSQADLFRFCRQHEVDLDAIET
jgi:DNA-binding NtrC family response regulator